MTAVREWLIGLAMAGAPVLVLAQDKTATPPPAQKPPTAIEGVTVTATAPDVQTTIDRKSFTLNKDLQATTGSIGDALRNLPSVEVDLQGQLTLRGDPNVTILVDGKPAPQFQGQGRADALQQIGADQYERVEVVTSPSAELNPEGTGVINLISRKTRGSGMNGTVYGTLASAGTKRTGLSAAFNGAKLSATASLAYSDVQNKSLTTDKRIAVDPITGPGAVSETDFHGRNRTRTETENASITYQATPKDQLIARVQGSQMLLEGRPFNYFTETAPNGTVLAYQDRQGTRPITNDTSSVTASWKHSFAGDGHELSLDAVHNDEDYKDHFLYRTLRAMPAVAAPYERVDSDAGETHSELTLTYKRPLQSGASLKTGYELKLDRDDYPFNHSIGFDPEALAPIAALANRFVALQTLNAAYATYDQTLGDVTVQAGLRFEDKRLDLRQLTSGERDGQRYDRFYPTLHVSWRLDAERKLNFGFSERVNRPAVEFLNPLRYVIDPQNVQQGNPQLKPQITRALELGVEDKLKAGSSYSANFFYQRNEQETAYTLIDLGNGVYEQTFANLGRSQTAGVELSASAKLLPNVTFSANANLYWKEIGAAGLGFPITRSATGAGGRINLDWQARKDDLVQFNVVETGQRLLIQGFQQPSWTVNLGWRHKIDDRVTLTVTAQDLLWSSRYARDYDTPQLIQRFENRQWSRVVSLRLDYRFGGAGKSPAHDPGFEYDSGGGSSGR